MNSFSQEFNAQIKCLHHLDQDIQMIDLGKQKIGSSRVLCQKCIEDKDFKSLCMIDKIQVKINEYLNKHTGIQQAHSYEREKLQKLLMLLTTLNENQKKVMDNMISQTKIVMNSFCKSISEDLLSCSFTKLTRTKLEEIADILSQESINKSMLSTLQERSSQLGDFISQSFNTFKCDQQEITNQIYNIIHPQLKLENKLKQNNACQILISNQEQSLVVGGVGEKIVVWQQKGLQLIEQAVLKGHTDTVTALAIYKSGNMILSGGSGQDKSIKLWIKAFNKWNAVLTKNLNCSVNLLQLTPSECNLISTSSDKLVKIWTNSQFHSLELLQTLNDHTKQVNFVTQSSDERLMVTSCNEKYFIVYQSDTKKWKKLQQVATQGKIKRLHLIGNTKLVCQQKQPSKIILYSLNKSQEFEELQEVACSEIDKGKLYLPIFEMLGNMFICKNGKTIVILKVQDSSLCIFQTIIGNFECGCIDATGRNIILKDSDKSEVQFYGYERK